MRAPSASVAAARSTKVCETKECLSYVRRWLDAKLANLDDANQALEAAKHLHHDLAPPAGAPVYIQGSKLGHIALSTGGGKIYSTDWPKPGHCGEVKIAKLCKQWGRTYAGWSTDYAGQPIPGLEAAHPFPGTTRRPMKGPQVKQVQRRLQQLGFTIDIDSSFGPETELVVKAFQKRKGLEVVGYVGPKTWAALWH